MAIELNKRTKILAGAGVLVLAVAGAGAWFFLFDEPPPPPPAKAPAAKGTPAKDAGAPKGETAKADPAKADAPKAAQAGPATAASAPKPAARPIPTDPNKLVAEVVESSGMQAYFQAFGRDSAVRARADGKAPKDGAGADEARAAGEIANRVFEPAKMNAEMAAALKGNLDAVRMGRFLELLRQPVVQKVLALETRNVTPEAMQEFGEALRKNPPAPARAKLLQTVDEVTQATEIGADMASAMARDMTDALLDGMQKAGRPVSREVRQGVGNQMNTLRNQSRAQARSILQVMYRDATDEDLAEFVKLLDTETGRWGFDRLATVMRPLMNARGSQMGREVAQLMVARQVADAKAKPAAKAEETAAEKPAPAAPVAAATPPAPPEYQRPANVRTLYTRYNDLISATVMRDRAAVKELLDDGKYPNVRQSDGTTPLMVAAGNGDAEIATMLLAKGADPSLRAPGGSSALSIAKARKQAEMVRLLERAGARD